MNYIKHGLIPAEKARFIHNSTTVDVYDPETNTYSTRDGEYYTIDFYRKRADIIIENRFVKFSTCRIRHGRVVDAAVLLETERGELVILKHDNVRLNNIFEMISTYSVGDIVAFDIDDFICNLNQPHIFVSNVGEDFRSLLGCKAKMLVPSKRGYVTAIGYVIKNGENIFGALCGDEEISHQITRSNFKWAMVKPRLSKSEIKDDLAYQHYRNFYRECMNKKHNFLVRDFTHNCRTYMALDIRFMRLENRDAVLFSQPTATKWWYVVDSQEPFTLPERLKSQLTKFFNTLRNSRNIKENHTLLECMKVLYPERVGYIDKLCELCKPNGTENIHNKRKEL